MTVDENTDNSKNLADSLSKEYIEEQVSKSKYPEKVRDSIQSFYNGLDRPAAPMLAFAKGGGLVDEDAPKKILASLKENGINAVLASDQEATDSKAFVVSDSAIYAPFLSPQEALSANIKMIEALQEAPVKGIDDYYSSPLTRESLAPAISAEKAVLKADTIYERAKLNGSAVGEVVASHFDELTKDNQWNNFASMSADIQKNNPELYAKIAPEIREKYEASKKDDIAKDEIALEIMQKYKQELSPHVFKHYTESMYKEAFDHGIEPTILDENTKTLRETGELKSVYHGGVACDPYAVLCGKNEQNMCFVYGAGEGRIDAMRYASGGSSHNCRANHDVAHRYGFLFEYESSGKDQVFTGIDSGPTRGTKDAKSAVLNDLASNETPIFAHQNKLKKLYIVATDRNYSRKLYPLELDENGGVKDKKWRTFCEIHKPLDDNLEGNLVARRNNMISEYDALGKEQMMRRTLGSIGIAPKTERSAERGVENSSSEPLDMFHHIYWLRRGKNLKLEPMDGSDRRTLSHGNVNQLQAMRRDGSRDL